MTSTEILARLGTFSPADVERFDQTVTRLNLVRGEFLLREGTVCRSAYFLLSGSVCQYREDDGEPQVIDLHAAHEWCFNHASFVEQRPSTTTLEVYADGTALELSIEQIHALIALSPAFLQMGRILQQGVSRLHYFDNSLTPLEKYEYVLAHRPHLLQAFPLKLIASYLKITPETLSRVREKLAKGSRVS
jgi:CRP-like cAMP-binding protein